MIVSGIGTLNMAAACAHLYNACRPSNEAWLNVGLAGHATDAPGDCRVAHSVEDSHTGKRWYPPFAYKPPCNSAHLICVDTVSDDYPVDALVDMESGGYFAIASKYTSAELVQSIKIVSDNRDNPSSELNPQQAHSLINGSLDKIEIVIDALRELASTLQPDTSFDITPPTGVRLSAAQRSQFEGLIQRWLAINPGTRIPFEQLDDARSSSEFLRNFSALLDRQAVSYPA